MQDSNRQSRRDRQGIANVFAYFYEELYTSHNQEAQFLKPEKHAKILLGSGTQTRAGKRSRAPTKHEKTG